MFAERPLCKHCGGSSHEQLRRQLGPHERQVRAIAAYYWLCGIGVALVGAALAFIWSGDETASLHEPFALAVFVLVIAAFGMLFCVAGWHVRRFTRAGQVLGIIGAIPGLLSFPVGSMISVFILWTLLGREGQAVFSEEYRAAAAATPHLKYGISIVTKLMLGLLLLLLLTAAFILGGGLK